jgi:predicted nucleotidyltransferase component of viral defense system
MWYSTALRKMTSKVLLKHEKNDIIPVYVPKETILKKIAAKIEKVKPHFFFDLVRELSDTHHTVKFLQVATYNLAVCCSWQHIYRTSKILLIFT